MDLILKKAIKDTIEYGRQYGVEYGRDEIKERLISNKVFSDKKVEEGLVNYELRINNYEFNKILNKKIRKAERLAQILAESFKDILLIGITGSVAAGYPKNNDDIDLMVITKKNRLWLTRLKLRIFITRQQIPHRKYGQVENKDEFCFNLWLDEGSLELPDSKQMLKNAMDLILMKPILNRKNIYEEFIKENDWAKNYVARGYGEKIRKNLQLKAGVARTEQSEKGGDDLVGKIVNWLVFWPQYLYMRKRLNNELIGLSKAFFHPTKDSGRIKT